MVKFGFTFWVLIQAQLAYAATIAEKEVLEQLEEAVAEKVAGKAAGSASASASAVLAAAAAIGETADSVASPTAFVELSRCSGAGAAGAGAAATGGSLKTAFTLNVDTARESHQRTEITARYEDIAEDMHMSGKTRINPQEGPSGPLSYQGSIIDGQRAENQLMAPLPYTRGYDGGPIGPEGYIVK